MAELPSYLHELDQLLLDQGDDWMLLTQLDGYLTGVLVSPDGPAGRLAEAHLGR